MADEDPDSLTQLITNPNWRKPINGRLPPDSLTQIWARLPIKSLYKFRSVCKLWNFLISSDPLLSDLRHQLHHSIPPPPPPNLILFLRHLPDEPVKVPDRPVHLSIRPFEELFRVDRDPNTHSIKNGFTPYVDFSLQFLPSKGPIVCFVSDRYFYLCNPSTQEFLRLPPGPNGNSITSNGGFGFLGDENRYVVGLTGEKCEFFEFGPGLAGSGCWRQIKQSCPVQVKRFGLMVNREFYWTVENGPGFVVCLDVKEEEFRVIPAPQGNENEIILYDLLYLVEFKGCLCAVDNYSRPSRMEIWVLNQIEGEFIWNRKFNIFISGMARDVVYPFCDYEGENGGDMVLCNETRSRLYSYNLKNRSIKQVYRPKHRTNDRLAFYEQSSQHIFGLNISPLNVDCVISSLWTGLVLYAFVNVLIGSLQVRAALMPMAMFVVTVEPLTS
ncbi:F-box protein At5g18160-like [Chenopodium quinoa]|uniref:F-box protein At5g18160-like n=1 Tax=Chenopodium quinoa TaxID=63459 RepID=UPI000B7777ED|nr:F-box protein At5g18160-like [Chenopodium quinoa]